MKHTIMLRAHLGSWQPGLPPPPPTLHGTTTTYRYTCTTTHATTAAITPTETYTYSATGANTNAPTAPAAATAAATAADGNLARCNWVRRRTGAGAAGPCEEPSAEPSGGGVPGESAQYEGHGEHLRVASCSAAAVVSG
jgi:hypothetical protein